VTRINVIPPEELADQHLLAEYRELPRTFALARPGVKVPEHYTLGKGHVLFFYPRTGWLSRRQAALITECQRRGFQVQHVTPPPPVPGCDGEWHPTPEAVAVNLARLQERLAQRPGWYTLRGVPVPPTFYGAAP
jgi:deoxyribonuclease (pyrimidine dimer)